MASGNTLKRMGIRHVANKSGSVKAAVNTAAAARRRAWLRDEHRKSPHCRCCNQTTSLKRRGQPYSATVDHIVPLSRGGADMPHNWNLLCLTCNRLKADNLPNTDQRRTA